MTNSGINTIIIIITKMFVGGSSSRERDAQAPLDTFPARRRSLTTHYERASAGCVGNRRYFACAHGKYAVSSFTSPIRHRQPSFEKHVAQLQCCSIRKDLHAEALADVSSAEGATARPG